MAAAASAPLEKVLQTNHEDVMHDATLDYYGRRLATCSSDRTIKIYEISGSQQNLVETLRGHEGPVWQTSWAHPKYGTILASAGYDGQVIIWKEQDRAWIKLVSHNLHQGSVNSVAWAPHELGAILACASSDGKVSVLEFKDDGTWDTKTFHAHDVGCNAASWAPKLSPGSLVARGVGGASGKDTRQARMFVTGGCDNTVKTWAYDLETDQWVLQNTLTGHTDWVRDVAWAPSIGLPKSYIASASQDKHVYIWTRDTGDSEWQRHDLRPEGFPDIAWRVSWSLSGSLLAVSCGNNRVYLYKEVVKGWELVKEIDQ